MKLPVEKDTRAVDDTTQFEFAIVPADFDTVRSLVQRLYRHARAKQGSSDQAKFSWKEKLVLWRHRFHQVKFICEKDMRIIEPFEHSDVTVLSVCGNAAFLRCLSGLLPSIEIVEFASIVESPKHQMHGLYVRSAGKIVRRAEASIGIHSSNWDWQENGLPTTWEDTSRYTQKQISKRQTRATLADDMVKLGFDAVRYLEDGVVARQARFRGG